MTHMVLPRAGAACLALALAAFSTLASGCYAEATTGGVIRAEYAPDDITVYPHEYYDGHVVYLIGDRWYFEQGGQWVYYAHEPRPLVRRRIVIRRHHTVRRSPVVHEAPPAHRGRREWHERHEHHEHRYRDERHHEFREHRHEHERRD